MELLVFVGGGAEGCLVLLCVVCWECAEVRRRMAQARPLTPKSAGCLFATGGPLEPLCDKRRERINMSKLVQQSFFIVKKT